MRLQLNLFETFMARAAEKAELCDFTTSEFQEISRVEISGEAIRAVLMGEPVVYHGESEAKVVKLPGSGIRVKKKKPEEPGVRVLQAHITGALDLEYGGMPDGSPLPHLSLLACAFDEPIKLSHARLKGLSLAGSYLKHIDARQAVFEGDVDLAGIMTSEDKAPFSGAGGTGRCWAEFRGAKIRGSFFAPGSRLVAPEKRSEDQLSIEGRRNALDLGHCHVDSVILNQEFSAFGGVSLGLAHVDGTLRLDGAHLTCVEGAALYAPNIDVRGDVKLRTCRRGHQDNIAFHASGEVNLSSSKIGGDLEIMGARIEGDLNLKCTEINGITTIAAVEGFRDGKREIFPMLVDGDIDLSASKMHGSFGAGGARIKGQLNLATAEINGLVNLTHFESGSGENHEIVMFSARAINIVASKIHGSFTIVGAEISNEFVAITAEVSGFFAVSSFAAMVDGKAKFYPFSAKALHLDAAKIHGSFGISGAHIDGPVSAATAEIDGLFAIGPNFLPNGDKFEVFPFSIQSLIIAAAKIRGTLGIGGGRIDGPLSAQTAEIGGGLTIMPVSGMSEGEPTTLDCTITGSVDLNDIKVGGQFEMSGTQLKGGFSAPNAVIGNDMNLATCDGWEKGEAKLFRFTSDKGINLSGAHIGGDLKMAGAQLDEGLAAPNCLVGGTLSMGAFKSEASKGQSAPFQSKKDINLQGAQVGADFDMRKAVLGRWPHINPFRCLRLKNVNIGGNFHRDLGAGFLSMFTYGRRGEYLRAIFRSLVIAAFAWMIGWVLVSVADHSPLPGQLGPLEDRFDKRSVMVLDTGTVQTRDASTPYPGSVLLAQEERPCGDQIDPLVYALDIFIPLLDLRQESRCEVSAAPGAQGWRIIFMFYSLLGWGLMSWLLFDIARIAASGPGRTR